MIIRIKNILGKEIQVEIEIALDQKIHEIVARTDVFRYTYYKVPAA